jgi:hypothetical protein
MKLKKIIILPVLAVLLMLSVSACSPTVTVNVNTEDESENNEETTEAETITASLMLDHQDGTVKTFSAETTDHTVFGLTKKVAEDNGLTFVYDPPGEWGVFIKEIDGLANGTDRFWQFWVNNNFGDRAADQYGIAGGDIVEWKYVKSQF